MHRNRVSTLLASGATAALLALTAACGSASGGSDAGSGKGSGGDSSSSNGGSEGAVLTKSDIFSKLIAAQKKAGSYTFTMKLGSGSTTSAGTGEADASQDPAAVHVSLEQGGKTIETVSVDGISYIKGLFPGSDKWLKLDPKAKGGMGALLGSANSSDPAAQLAAISDAATVKKGGSQSIGGVDTTEYDVTVPGSALVKKSKLPKSLASAMPKEVTYKLFVDGDDLLRRLSTAFTISGQDSNISIDFADYGKDVSIAAPPAAQTTDKFPGLGQ